MAKIVFLPRLVSNFHTLTGLPYAKARPFPKVSELVQKSARIGNTEA